MLEDVQIIPCTSTSTCGDGEPLAHMPELSSFICDDVQKAKEEAINREIAKNIEFYNCVYDCGAKISIDNSSHIEKCLRRPKIFHCLFEKDDNGESCQWQGTARDLIATHTNSHKRNVVVLQNCIDFTIRLLQDEPLKLIVLYDLSYVKNEIYWLRTIEMEKQQTYVIVEHIASIFNGEIQDRITLTSFWITYIDSPEIGNIGRVVPQNSDLSTRKNRAVSVDSLLNQKLPLMIQFVRKTTMPKNIATLLECPVCSETMSSNIMLCSEGHSLCMQCRKFVEECPLCKCAMSNSRNFALEQLWSAYNNICKYRKFGCMDEFNVEQLQQHEKYCWFRNVICPACQWIGPWPMFDEHEGCDKRYIFPGQVVNISITRDLATTICFISNLYDTCFVLVFSTSDSTITAEVFHMATDTKKNFYFTLKLFNIDSSVTYTGRCSTILTDQQCSSKDLIVNTSNFEVFEGKKVEFGVSFDVYYKIQE